MKKLVSKKFHLPTIYFISDIRDISTLPVGIPYLYADEGMEEHLVKMLEYEMLYAAAKKTGLPFKFKDILKDNGYKGLDDYTGESTYVNGSDLDIDKITSLNKNRTQFDSFIRDTSVYVDVTVLKSLNIIPVWLDSVETAIQTNIHNFVVYNPHMYNKKLEGMYGTMELCTPTRNLIIVDISTSVPEGVSATCLLLSKTLVETFYADLLITGSHSQLYSYEEVRHLDLKTVYEMGQGNESKDFQRLLFEQVKNYDTVVAFGDNDNPSINWNEYMSSPGITEAKEKCQWTINKLISLHTQGINDLAGYARWFNVKEDDIQRIDNWVKYLND